MKPRESDVYSEARYAQLRGQVTRGGESRRVVVETCRSQFIANLPVKLLMQWFGRCAIQPNQFKGQDRMAASFPMKIRRWIACSRKLSALGACSRFIGVRRWAFSSDHEQEHEHEHGESNYPSKVVWPFRPEWIVDTLPQGQKLSLECKLKRRAPIILKQKVLFILRECWTRSG